MGWNELGSWASTIAAKTTAVASDLAQKSKTAAVIASERAAKLKDNLKDEEYQQNLKKNVNETWNKTASTLSSWWSTAATAINENLGDGASVNGIPKLHNNEEMEQMSKRKRMPSLSSDQYFNNNQQQQRNESDILGMNGNANANSNVYGNGNEYGNANGDEVKKDIPAPFAKKNVSKKSKVENDDFDEWGFESNDDEQQQKAATEKENDAIVKDLTNKVDTLLDFDKNETKKKIVMDDPFLNDTTSNAKKNTSASAKDGNSSDELDAFFDELENESDDDKNKTNAKSEEIQEKELHDLMDSHENNKDKGKKEDDDDDWGW